MEPSFELGALDGIGGERDRPFVRTRGARPVAGTAQQLRVRRVQRLVALERGSASSGSTSSRPASGPEATPTAAARLSSTTGAHRTDATRIECGACWALVVNVGPRQRRATG